MTVIPSIRRLPLFASLLLLAACGDNAPAPPVAADALAPHDVQGAGRESPLTGDTVSVAGIVSGDFQADGAGEHGNLGGYYLVSMQADDDPATSEGLFVYDRDAGLADVSVGDVVVVTGEVQEFHGETQLVASAVTIAGRAVPAVATVELPAAAIDSDGDSNPLADLEHLEGMRVAVTSRLYVQDLYGLERYGELRLSTRPREHQFTSTAAPDPAGYAAHREALAARTLLLDDGRRGSWVRPPRYATALRGEGRPPRIGDEVAALEGLLRYSRGSGASGSEGWRLMPVSEPRFESRNPRPARPAVGGTTVVASFNVLNWFDTPDDGSGGCGPGGSSGCRGADSVAERDRQRAKLVTAINALAADVVGLMELENDAGAALDDLVSALNAASPGWRHVETGVIGDDAIRVALLYRVGSVTPVGDHAVLDSEVDARFNDDRNRPALAQSFRADNGGVFTVAVNHLKSKGSSCAADGDPDRQDGQGNCNATRTRAAAALADWLASDPTGSGDPDVLIIGDLNAYLNEEPLLMLEGKGYVSLLRGEGRAPYSYVYRGESGALDHALATAGLAAQVTGVAEWHSNADEAPLIDYNLDRDRDPSRFDATTPWRASDHDPLLIGLDLRP